MEKTFSHTIHFVFWFVYLVLSASVGFQAHEGNRFIATYSHIYIGNAIWAVISFYLAYNYLHTYISKKQYWKYLIWSLVANFAITSIFFLLYNLDIFSASHLLSYQLYAGALVGSFIIGNCGVLIKGFLQWFHDLRTRNELENKQLQLEMELLKSQLNPHFMFNTLNNIDSLIYKNKEQASNALVQLSEILHYMLYSGQQERVSISQERQHLENIIALHALRHDQSNYIETSIDVTCHNATIAPLLLTPIVENTFKHSTYTGTLPVIAIKLSCTSMGISFSAINTYNKHNHSKTGGIGLHNLQRRLEILYPKKYKFAINNKHDIFEVILRIDFR